MNIEEPDKDGSTPLHWAVFSGSENCVRFLLSCVDNINIKDKLGYTPLHISVFSAKIRIIKKLHAMCPCYSSF